jgi:N-acetylmuramoyl-L-alanine amidase
MKTRAACIRTTLAGALCFWLLGASGAQAGFTTVVIDAGHGGHDRGGIPGQRVSEKDMTLDVARRLRARLEAVGLKTVMTRNSDVFVGLRTRVAIASGYRNAVFVSVHFNSASREGAHGYETYYYSRGSRSLALALHSEIGKVIPSDNRGVRSRSYYVLRRNRLPAVLCEPGFLTNRNEARTMEKSAYRDQLAARLATALIRMSGR